MLLDERLTHEILEAYEHLSCYLLRAKYEDKQGKKDSSNCVHLQLEDIHCFLPSRITSPFFR